MKSSLSAKDISTLRGPLKKSNLAFTKINPGESPDRQPVHTVYGGAQIFSHEVSQKMGEVAAKHLKAYAPDAKSLMTALGDSTGRIQTWELVYKRVVDKLKKDAVEDFRIDFEDGYGNRPDAEEDGHAESAALEVVKGMGAKTLPPFIGIRVKPFNEERVARSLRTIDIFLSTLLKASKNKLPSNFVVTLPKVQIVEQAQVFEKALTLIEKRHKLKHGTLQCELMVETPQSIIDAKGVLPIRSFVNAMKGRCRGMHFGTYDYTAGCNITANYQAMDNPVCDFAKHVMQVSLAGMPVMLSDGATNIMPIPPHRGESLSSQQKSENLEAVHRVWRLSYGHIRHSLETGYYQGWDLHPAQLPIRYATIYAFFLESYEQTAARLSGFVEKAAKATLLGDVFDDAATGQGLLNYFLRGMSCGAISQDEALSTGLSIADFQSRSFLKILEART